MIVLKKNRTARKYLEQKIGCTEIGGDSMKQNLIHVNASVDSKIAETFKKTVEQRDVYLQDGISEAIVIYIKKHRSSKN